LKNLLSTSGKDIENPSLPEFVKET